MTREERLKFDFESLAVTFARQALEREKSSSVAERRELRPLPAVLKEAGTEFGAIFMASILEGAPSSVNDANFSMGVVTTVQEITK